MLTTFMCSILYLRIHVTTLFFSLVVANELNVHVLLATSEGFYSSSKTNYVMHSRHINKWLISVGISRSHNLNTHCFLVNQATRKGSEITLLGQTNDGIRRNRSCKSDIAGLANRTLFLTFYYRRTIVKTLESLEFWIILLIQSKTFVAKHFASLAQLLNIPFAVAPLLVSWNDLLLRFFLETKRS